MAVASANAAAAGKRTAENAEATETYHKLSDALAQANAAVEQLAAAESQARQEQQQLPLIEVFPSHCCRGFLAPPPLLLDPLGLALAAGLAMAIGTGLLLRGMPRGADICHRQPDPQMRCRFPWSACSARRAWPTVGGRSAAHRRQACCAWRWEQRSSPAAGSC